MKQELNGFIQVPKYLVLSQELSAEAKMVYIILKGHCFEKQSCFPSLDTISKESSMSGYKCLKGIKELLKNKFISKRRRGLGLTNVYYLNEDAKSTYDDYLLSPHWLEFKKEVLKFYGKKCSHCGDTKKLNVHHLNYDCLGKETFNDVIVLCQNCHKKEHGIS